MKKYLLTGVLVVFMLASGLAQQLSTYTLYRDNWNILNPAIVSNNYINHEYNMSVGANYRYQWVDLEDAPNSQAVSFEFVPNGYNMITGGHLINDQTGLIGQTGIYGTFAYRLQFARRVEQSLMFGINAGIVQYRAKLNGLELSNPNDPFAQAASEVQYFPDFGLGVFYHYADVFYAGISVPQTFGLNTSYRAENGDFNIQRTQHFYGIVGGYITLDVIGDGTSYLEPTLWVKYVKNAPISLDANIRYQFSDVAWLGIGGNLAKTVHFEGGVVLGENVGWLDNGQMKVGFGFDRSFNTYAAFFGNAFELNVTYSWAY